MQNPNPNTNPPPVRPVHDPPLGAVRFESGDTWSPVGRREAARKVPARAPVVGEDDEERRRERWAWPRRFVALPRPGCESFPVPTSRFRGWRLCQGPGGQALPLRAVPVYPPHGEAGISTG
jgi:hypothetical protein